MSTRRIDVVLATCEPGVGRAGVGRVRERQRAALQHALALRGVHGSGELPRRADGAPAPLVRDTAEPIIHWSAANTRGAALGAVAGVPLGVDLESLERPRVPSVEAFADAEERALIPRWDRANTLALWCAKEAILKLTGIGIADLRRCRLVEVPHGQPAPDTVPPALVLRHAGLRRRVALTVERGHVIALAAELDGADLPQLAVRELSPAEVTA